MPGKEAKGTGKMAKKSRFESATNPQQHAPRVNPSCDQDSDDSSWGYGDDFKDRDFDSDRD